MPITPASVTVIDGDPFTRRHLRESLRAAAFDVEELATATSFLDLMPAAKPSCVVVNMHLPDMHGLEFQQALLRRKDCGAVIFIATSGTVQESVSAMKAGAVDFLLWPVAHHALHKAVHTALRRSEQLLRKTALKSAARARLGSLTPRQQEVLVLLVKGMLNREIAGELGAAEATIKIHRKHIMEKMQVHSLPELVVMAQAAGVKVPCQLAIESNGNSAAFSFRRETSPRWATALPQPAVCN